MRQAVFINDNRGTIINVSKDKTKIKILLLKGGTVKARNEGFEKGDQVCFTVNAAKTKIIKVIPKIVADVTAVIGLNPALRAATEEQPEDLEQDFDEHEYYDEETIIEEDEDESRSEATRDADEGERKTKFTFSNGS